MIRLLFWAFIAWLIVAGARKLLAGGGSAAARQAPAEDMVRCVTCQLNVPKSEAIAVASGWACCAQHAGPAAPIR